jgi:hypothetical protein
MNTLRKQRTLAITTGFERYTKKTRQERQSALRPFLTIGACAICLSIYGMRGFFDSAGLGERSGRGAISESKVSCSAKQIDR